MAAAMKTSEMPADTKRMRRPRFERPSSTSTAWPGCSNSSGRCSRSVLGADVCKRLLHRGRLGDLVFLVGLELVCVARVLLVVRGLRVHGPDVVVRAVADVLDGADRGERRVVGVVVAVQSVASDLMQV